MGDGKERREVDCVVIEKERDYMKSNEVIGNIGTALGSILWIWIRAELYRHTLQ